jgi:hypothetical protein
MLVRCPEICAPSAPLQSAQSRAASELSLAELAERVFDQPQVVGQLVSVHALSVDGNAPHGTMR